MARTIVIFTSKPRHMCFGGNDAFVVQLIKSWPSKEDKIVFAFNSSHPCRELFLSRLLSHATIELLEESLIAEKRFAIAAKIPHSPIHRFLFEFWDDTGRLFESTACIYRLFRFLRQIKPDVVMVNAGGNPPEDLALRMMIASRLQRVPRVLLVNHNYPGQGTNVFRRITLYVLRRITKYFCDVLVVPSQDMARIISRSMKDKREAVVIPYGIDPLPENGRSLSDKQKELGLGNSLVVGAVGNLEERKGFHVLVKGFPVVLKQFPEAILVLIGSPVDPIYAEQLKQLIHSLGLEGKVKNLGYKADAAQYFECFDVCVVPSIYSEGFGMVAIEALRYNKPIVAAATGGLTEVLVDGETGYLVPSGDSSALAEAIVKLLRSPELRAQMGCNSFQRFSSHFQVRGMIDRYFQLTR